MNLPALLLFSALVVLAHSKMIPIVGHGSNKCPNDGDRIRKVELFVMSQCEYGVQTLINFATVLQEVGSSLDFNLYYIVRESGSTSTGFKSLHGTNEVWGDMWELCALEHYNQHYKFMDFIVCLSSDYKQIPSNVANCTENVGMNYTLLADCFSNGEAKDLLRESAKECKRQDVSASPTILINGYNYQAGRSPDQLIQAVCNPPTPPSTYHIILPLIGVLIISIAVVGVVVITLLVRYRARRVHSYHYVDHDGYEDSNTLLEMSDLSSRATDTSNALASSGEVGGNTATASQL